MKKSHKKKKVLKKLIIKESIIDDLKYNWWILPFLN